jgi:tetratricopeptide (TPR) repeat protein
VIEGALRLAQGALDEAESCFTRVLAEARSLGAEVNEAQALCMLGRVWLARGDAEAAAPGLERCVALAGSVGAEYERAQALAALAEARAACADADPACEDLLGAAITLFEKMGARYDLGRALEARERLVGSLGG